MVTLNKAVYDEITANGFKNILNEEWSVILYNDGINQGIPDVNDEATGDCLSIIENLKFSKQKHGTLTFNITTPGRTGYYRIVHRDYIFQGTCPDVHVLEGDTVTLQNAWIAFSDDVYHLCPSKDIEHRPKYALEIINFGIYWEG